ncbi:MAG: YceI family protein [Gemmatimonadota bacterium]
MIPILLALMTSMGSPSSVLSMSHDGLSSLWSICANGLSSGVAVQDTVRMTLRVAPEGNQARYRVREQLAMLEFPNDAVGQTSEVWGAIVLNPDGSVDLAESRIQVDLAALTSDSERRDGFLRRNTLETDQHPTLTLVPTFLRGLPNPLPETGDHRFSLVGDLLLKGECFPTAWEVEATFVNGAVLGRASTVVTFQSVGLEKPQVGSVLSVADDIRLEIDFRMVPNQFP